MNPKPKPRTKRVTFHLTTDTVKSLEKLADKDHQNVSQIIRAAIDKYMNVDLYKEDSEFIANIVRKEVKEQIERQANRLASMMFKIGIISASNYFMSVRTLSDMISPSMQEDFRDINSNARKLGIDYMKLNGVGVIQYLEDDEAIQRAADKIKTDLYEIQKQEDSY
jgi:predicted transcriptional regulator